jgi:hypothetical protein
MARKLQAPYAPTASNFCLLTDRGFATALRNRAGGEGLMRGKKRERIGEVERVCQGMDIRLRRQISELKQ